MRYNIEQLVITKDPYGVENTGLIVGITPYDCYYLLMFMPPKLYRQTIVGEAGIKSIAYVSDIPAEWKDDAYGMDRALAEIRRIAPQLRSELRHDYTFVRYGTVAVPQCRCDIVHLWNFGHEKLCPIQNNKP